MTDVFEAARVLDARLRNLRVYLSDAGLQFRFVEDKPVLVAADFDMFEEWCEANDLPSARTTAKTDEEDGR